jgi:hypothetical protein
MIVVGVVFDVDSVDPARTAAAIPRLGMTTQDVVAATVVPLQRYR